MTPFQKKAPIFIPLFLLVLLVNQVLAEDARLKNIIVTNTRDDLLIYLTVEGAFTEDMQTAILSGVATTFSFYINLNRVRSLWVDKEMVSLKITHTIKYDNLKNEFTVQRSWEDDKPITLKSIEEAEKMMAEIDSLKVVPLDQLVKGNRYQIRAKAELSKVRLPLYLHYILFFVSMWDFETDWYTIDFIY
jgi:hypothetical protein